jgi:hypothetical protein
LVLTRASCSITTDFLLTVMAFRLNLIAVNLVLEALVYLSSSIIVNWVTFIILFFRFRTDADNDDAVLVRTN